MPSVTSAETPSPGVAPQADLRDVSGSGVLAATELQPPLPLRSIHVLRPFFPFPAVLALIVLSIVFVMARGRVADPDIWWHLHNAESLVHNRALPQYDSYSFTVHGYPWMDHEWLAELPFYLAWKLVGMSGIGALTVALLSLIYLGLLYLTWKESGNFKAATIATVCAIFLGRSAFGPRTILFGYVFLICLLLVLQRLRQRGRAPLSRNPTEQTGGRPPPENSESPTRRSRPS